MKVRTAELAGQALDWAVAKCLGQPNEWVSDHLRGYINSPSTDWAQGGPIIERELIDILHVRQSDLSVAWDAWFGNDEWVMTGPTPLIAAMRCYVASKLGDEVEIPEELK